MQALRDGHRDAVIVLPAGFGADLAAGHADIAVYYDQSNPVTQSTARMAVESIVASFNPQVSGQAAADRAARAGRERPRAAAD